MTSWLAGWTSRRPVGPLGAGCEIVEEYSGAGTASLPITLYSIVTEPALSFGQAAAAYDRVRPTLPVAAVPLGTGRADRNGGRPRRRHRPDDPGDPGRSPSVVIPVEPDAGMRAQLDATTPASPPRPGRPSRFRWPTATPTRCWLGRRTTGSTGASARADRARAERPGGIFAPIWNIRDERVPWVAALTGDAFDRPIAVPSVTEGHLAGRRFRRAVRAPWSTRPFGHSVAMDADGLVALIASRSYLPDRDAATPGRDRRSGPGNRGRCQPSSRCRT